MARNEGKAKAMREFGIAIVIALMIGVVGYAIVGLSGDDDTPDQVTTTSRPGANAGTGGSAADDGAADDGAADDGAADDGAGDDGAGDDGAADDGADGAAGEVSAARGEAVASATGCLACHATDGSAVVGPGWGGLFGSTEELEGGESVVVDEAYLHESIVNPSARIVAGFGNLMPGNYGDSLSADEIDSLVAYIVSLQ